MSWNTKYHFVYKTTNLINGNFYIGVHSTNNLNDEYLGSGLLVEKAIKKYGRENFSRVILKFFECKDKAYQYEANLVTEDFIKSNPCYNIAIGGNGGYLGEKSVQKMKKSKKGKPPWNKGLWNPNKCRKCGSLTSRNDTKHCQPCSYLGVNNPAWKGYYKTPLGLFVTAKEASSKHGFSPQTLKRRIQSDKFSDFYFIKE